MNKEGSAKLLTEEELRNKLYYGPEFNFDEDTADKVIELIQSQKQAHGEMVIGEDLTLAEFKPGHVPFPGIETAMQIEGKNRHNELLAEQRERNKL